MIEETKQRVKKLQQKMAGQNIDVAVITEESSIAYLAGFWGYLGIEFGRPTFLIVFQDRDPVVITPLMESEMVSAMTWVTDVRVWEDSGDNTWARALQGELGSVDQVWVEKDSIPAIVRNFFESEYKDLTLNNISPILGDLRMIKSPGEIAVMKQAGEIAGAMMEAAHNSLGEGLPEYESAIAVIAAGSRKAASFLTASGWERFISPMIHNLQILQSGADASMVHRRASVKTYEKYDPVYFCFCTMAQFKQYKLGFDRMFHIGDVRDLDRDVQIAAIDAQQAALHSIKSGIIAEDVAKAANEIYRERNYQTGYRTGRSIGTAYLEAPELKEGDKTVLRPGMTFAVDGGISVDGKTAGRIGDSIVVTETGFEYLTNYPREILIGTKS
jgi:Xaa-Pro aminopeptidase